MAATLTDSGELTYASFPIDKIETNEDGDLIVYGKATDGSVDSDMQIVDPAFAAKAIGEWKATGANLRVQHNAQRDPAGVGLDVRHDGDATWVKSLVLEPIAKKLVAKGALRAYSVGIAHPIIERDVTGRARGGIIKGGEIVEISLVDRPANKSCGFQLVKAEGDSVEYTGKMFGDESAIEKALKSDPAELFAHEDVIPESEQPAVVEKSDVSAFNPDSIIDFTPNDLAELLKNKIIKQHYSELASDAAGPDIYKSISDEEAAILGKDHREFSSSERQHQSSEGNALPDGSYPIPDTDALRRAAILARSKHGNYQAASRLIARRARELGVSNPMEDANKAEQPDVIKDPDTMPGEALSDPASIDADGDRDGDGVGMPGEKAAAPKKMPKKGKDGKKLPPWLNKPASGDDCKMDHEHTEKCHTTPKDAAGVPSPDMTPAPVGDLMESPAKDHMKGLTESAFMRFKTIGIDTDMGMIHDMTCPAYHPEDVAKYYPYTDLAGVIDEELFQRKALTAATGKSLSDAMEAQQVWQAATLLKTINPEMLNDFRFEAHKAFRDANPGPTSYPTPGEMSPAKFHRGVITDGHAQNGPGYGSPNSSPSVASSSPDAHHFDRPPLGAGHATPSPSFMKGGVEYPEANGMPTHIRYAEIEKEKARRAVSMMHDHVMHNFPGICPVLDQDAYAGENMQNQHPINIAGKSVEVERGARVLDDVYKDIRKLQKKVERGELTEDQARTRLSRKTAERYAKDLQKQVQDGITSIDEVKKALGLPTAPQVQQQAVQPIQAADAVSPTEVAALQAALSKLAADSGFAGKVIVLPPGGAAEVQEPVEKGVVPEVGKSLTPDVMKSMMTEILEPLQSEIAALKAENTEYKAKFDETNQQLSENSQRWEALANQSDPATVAFAGLALNPLRRPAGVVEKADLSEQVQGMMQRQLERTWRTSEIPAEREAAYAALQRLKGMSD